MAPKGRLALAPLACLSQPADGFRHASLRAARNGARLAVAGKLLGLMAASLTDSEGDGDPSRLGGRVALCRAAAFGPTRTGDRRSWAIPTARNFPEMPLECPQAVSEPVAEASGLGACSPARQIGRPVLHEPTPTLEQIRAPVRRLNLVVHHMRQRRLHDLSGMIRLFGRPVAERRCGDPCSGCSVQFVA